MKIERPDWFHEAGILDSEEVLREYLNEWFDQHVEPVNKMLSEGVEVYGFPSGHWSKNKTTITCDPDTHKALLINIQPIKKETAEDVLMDWMGFMNKAVELHKGPYTTISELDEEASSLYKRAKAVLGDTE